MYTPNILGTQQGVLNRGVLILGQSDSFVPMNSTARFSHLQSFLPLFELLFSAATSQTLCSV